MTTPSAADVAAALDRLERWNRHVAGNMMDTDLALVRAAFDAKDAEIARLKASRDMWHQDADALRAVLAGDAPRPTGSEGGARTPRDSA